MKKLLIAYVLVFVLLFTTSYADTFNLPAGYYIDYDMPMVIDHDEDSCHGHEIEVGEEIINIAWRSLNDYQHHRRVFYDSYCRLCKESYTNIYIPDPPLPHEYELGPTAFNYEQQIHIFYYSCNVCEHTFVKFSHNCGIFATPSKPCTCSLDPFS